MDSTDVPRRSRTLFEKSGESVRRLARRLSHRVLGSRERSRPPSVATIRSDAEVSSLLGRPGSRSGPAELRRPRVTGMGLAVVDEEEGGEDLIRSATPRGFDDKARGSGGEEEVQIPWQIPKAKVFQQTKNGKQSDYDITPLVYGRKETDLWLPTGDTLIYLCSKTESSRYTPSFKLSSSTLRKKSEFFAAALSERWQEHSASHRQLLNLTRARYILYFPPWYDPASEMDTRKADTEDDFHNLLDQLVATRNFFAYIFNHPAIYLEEPLGLSLLQDFMDRMDMYMSGPSSNANLQERPSREQTLREVEDWVKDNRIDDPRIAQHRIIDTLVASEHYQWPEIYTEAFIHGAGRYDYLQSMPNFSLVSPATQQLLERASYSIKARVQATEATLKSFDFAILSNPWTKRRRGVRGRGDEVSAMDIPSAWRKSYAIFSKWVVEYYMGVFRIKSWPPSRFSRGMILQLKNDFDALYELLVDPNPDTNDPYRRLMSLVLTDLSPIATLSTPPLPLLPMLPPEGSPLRDRQQNRDAISVILLDSYNLRNSGRRSGFVEAFKEFERSQGTGRVVTKSVEAREGRWCLIYAILSTLRSVTMEWEGLRYQWGVEYWLCAELKGIPLWAVQRRSADGSGSARGLGRNMGGSDSMGNWEPEREELQQLQPQPPPPPQAGRRSVFG